MPTKKTTTASSDNAAAVATKNVHSNRRRRRQRDEIGVGADAIRAWDAEQERSRLGYLPPFEELVENYKLDTDSKKLLCNKDTHGGKYKIVVCKEEIPGTVLKELQAFPFEDQESFTKFFTDKFYLEKPVLDSLFELYKDFETMKKIAKFKEAVERSKFFHTGKFTCNENPNGQWNIQLSSTEVPEALDEDIESREYSSLDEFKTWFSDQHHIDRELLDLFFPSEF